LKNKRRSRLDDLHTGELFFRDPWRFLVTDQDQDQDQDKVLQESGDDLAL